jgi:transposase
MAGAIVKAEWLSDARKIPDEVMNYLRPIAVQAIEEKHYSPELIADILGISRRSIYEWLRLYRAGGEAALETGTAPGAPPVITPIMEWWLAHTVLNATPIEHGYDTLLGTRSMLAELVKKPFGIGVSESTGGLPVHQRDVSGQQPWYRAVAQDPAKVAAFLEVKFPKSQRVAAKRGADIAVEEEAGGGIMTRSGRPGGNVGQPPAVAVSDRRGGSPVLSLITATGDLPYSLEDKTMNGER